MNQKLKQQLLLLDVQDELAEHRAKLMTELRQSLAFESLLPDVFKHGPIKVAWQIKHDGVWTKAAPNWAWQGAEPKRAVLYRGDVDQAILPEKQIPSFVRRPWK